jgi:hypothetical protein
MPRTLHHRGKSPGAHWMGGWVGSGAGLDASEKRKKVPLLPYRELNPSHPVRSLVTIPTELPRLLHNDNTKQI